MYQVQLTFYVHLGKLIEFRNEGNRSDAKIGVFVKDLELPFPPYVGLQIQRGRFLTPPITHATYDTENNSFSCSFESDDNIPKTAAEIEKAMNVDWSPSDVDKYIEFSSKNRIDRLISQGWEHRGTV